MIQYKPKPSTCEACPWYAKSKGYAYPTGDPNSKLWTVAESAGENEAIYGKPLVGWSGQCFNADLGAAGTRREQVFVDNVIRCWPPTGNKIKIPQNVIDYCTSVHLGPNLAQRLQRPEPLTVVAVGEYAMRYFSDRKQITKQRGSVLEYQSATIIPTVHWAATAHRPKYRYLRTFIRYDIAKAIEFAFDPAKLVAFRHKQIEQFNIEPTLVEIAEAFTEIRQAKRVTIDIEHAGGAPWNCQILCIGFYYSGKGLCVPWFGYRGAKVWSDADFDTIMEWTGDLLADPSITKIFQNGNSDTIVLESYGFRVAGFTEDTMIKHKTVFNDSGVPHKLGFIGATHGVTPYSKDEAKGQESFALIDPKILRTYNLRDCKITDDSDVDLDWYLDERKVRHVYEHDMKLNDVIRRMMQRGVMLDQVAQQAYYKELDKEVADIDEDLLEILGESFNPRSPRDMGNLIYKTLGFVPPGETKSGRGKLDFDTMVTLQDSLPPDDALRPLFDLFTIRAKQSKLKSTYLKDFVTDRSGALHTTFNLHVVPSGRLSSNDPNLQNLPRQKDEGKRIKKLIRARPGFTFISRDYAQIELILFAYLANDTPLIAASRATSKAQDMHSISANDMFSVAACNEMQRDVAKTFHYGGILYGGGPDTIRAQILRQLLRGRKTADVPSEARIAAMQTQWFAKHPAARTWINNLESSIAQSKRATTYFLKRPRFFINTDPKDASRAGRSHVVSGSAADIINAAMLRIDSQMESPNAMVLQIHDELLFEVQKSKVDYYLEMTKREMEQPLVIGQHTVVFKTSAAVGPVWGEMEDVSEQ